jgi:hypothetical protein
LDSSASSAQASKQSEHRARRIVLPLAILVLSIVLIQFSRVTLVVNRVTRDMQSLQTMADSGALALMPPDASGDLEARVAQSAEDFREMRAAVGWLANFAPLFGWLPRYGGDLANAPALLEFGERVTAGAQEMLALSRAFNAEIEAGRALRAPVGVSALRAAQSQAEQIQRARQNLDAATRARARIDAARLSPSLQALVYRFDKWLPLWEMGLDGLAGAPKLLGAQRPRVYLLVAQNSDELRATGGFISGVSLLQVDRGKISVTDFQDSYVVDDLKKRHPPPPEPLRQYMYAHQLLFRDANWSPDFPASAQQMLAIYQIDRGIAADGVIAVNLKFIPRLLEAVGPVTLEKYNERVDAANVIQKMLDYWASPQGIAVAPEWWQHRKDFTGYLFEALMRRLTAGEFEQARLMQALFDGVVTKDLLIYIGDADAAPSLARSGALYAGSGDALMIVDSNVGFNKVDGSIVRQGEYDLTLDSSGAARATLTITYTNLSPAVDAYCVHQPRYLKYYAELQQACYWDYVRVIAPRESELSSATREIGAVAEPLPQKRTSFGGYFVLARGETRSIRFDYRIPAALKDSSLYALRLEKQPGAPPVQMLVRVTVPEGWRAESANPAPARAVGSALEFSILLDRDQQIQVALGKPFWSVENVLGPVLALSVAAWFALRLRERQTRAKSRAKPIPH